MAQNRKIRPKVRAVEEGDPEIKDPTLRASANSTRDYGAEHVVVGGDAGDTEAYDDDFPEAERLRGAGLADKRAARGYAEQGGSFTDIEGIGKAKAKAIADALGISE